MCWLVATFGIRFADRLPPSILSHEKIWWLTTTIGGVSWLGAGALLLCLVHLISNDQAEHLDRMTGK